VSGRVSDVTELLNPREDLIERLRREPVVAVTSGTARRDQPAAPQHGEMLGERRLSDSKRFAKLKHGKLAFVEALQDVSAGWVGHRPKDPILAIWSHSAA
jgi:hypothetical protein